MGLKPVKSFHVTVSPYLFAGAKNVIMTSLSCSLTLLGILELRHRLSLQVLYAAGFQD